ncbi:MAG: hypothetical protein AAGB11_15960 [Pseudomonadota bacterium]
MAEDHLSSLNGAMEAFAKRSGGCARPVPIAKLQDVYDVVLDSRRDDGEEISLSPPRVNAVIHPTSMIQKHIERRETEDFLDLRDGIIKLMEEKRLSGGYGKR